MCQSTTGKELTAEAGHTPATCAGSHHCKALIFFPRVQKSQIRLPVIKFANQSGIMPVVYEYRGKWPVPDAMPPVAEYVRFQVIGYELDGQRVIAKIDLATGQVELDHRLRGDA
jgi:hypothetical protein